MTTFRERVTEVAALAHGARTTAWVGLHDSETIDVVVSTGQCLRVPLELVDLLTAPPAAVKICDERHGDVQFYVEDDGVSCYEIGWGHGGGPPEPGKHSQYKTLEEFSSRGWALYHDNDLHDGYGSLEELMRYLGPRVYLSLDEYRIGRSVPIEDVINAARAWAKLPPLKDTPQAEIDGTFDESDDEEEEEDE